jgi:hypothetical protein
MWCPTCSKPYSNPTAITKGSTSVSYRSFVTFIKTSTHIRNTILVLVSHYSRKNNEKLSEQPGLISWPMHYNSSPHCHIKNASGATRQSRTHFHYSKIFWSVIQPPTNVMVNNAWNIIIQSCLLYSLIIYFLFTYTLRLSMAKWR